MKRVFLFLGLFILGEASARELFYDELTYSIGMAAISFTENEKTIQGDNVSEAASGSVNSLSGNVQYKFFSDMKKSYYITTTFPLISAGTGVYINFGVGVEFYLSNLASKFGFYDQGTQVVLTPKLRYFWGGEVSGAYLVYNTETATKTDTLFELGVLGGLSYAFSDKITIKSSIAALKGTGVVSSTFGVRALVGASFYYD